MRRGLAVVGALLVVTGFLAACSSESEDRARESAPAPVPRHVQTAQGEAGEPVTLTYDASAGQVVQVWVQPLPEQTCPLELTLTSPDGDSIDLTTHDPMNRLDADGTWSWTYTPCADDDGAYALRGTASRDHPLRLGGPAVRLETHATYRDAATFVVPAEGRVALTGSHGGVVGPDGTRVVTFEEHGRVIFQDGQLLHPVNPQDHSATSRTYTVLSAPGGSEVRLVDSVEVEGQVDAGPIQLDPGPAEAVAAYEVAFTVAEDTWLRTPLAGWPETGDQDSAVEVEPRQGDSDPRRPGGVWHFAPGDYTARVTPPALDASGTLSLDSLTPTRIDGPGRYELSTGPQGEPALALHDLPGTYDIRVAGGPHHAPPWTLVWSTDTPPPPCVSALSCMSSRAVPSIPPPEQARALRWKPTIGGEGYLVLTGEPDQRITVVIEKQ